MSVRTHSRSRDKDTLLFLSPEALSVEKKTNETTIKQTDPPPCPQTKNSNKQTANGIDEFAIFVCLSFIRPLLHLLSLFKSLLSLPEIERTEWINVGVSSSVCLRVLVATRPKKLKT